MQTNTSSTELERVQLRNGLHFTVNVVITDVSLFTRYVLKEHAPKVQGQLALGKVPTKCNLVNALYDEINGWLDAPSIVGMTISSVELQPNLAFENKPVDPIHRVHVSELVDILSDLYKLGLTPKVDLERLEALRKRARHVLNHIGCLDFDDVKTQPVVPPVGNSLL